jgi:hypothetical protein
MSAFQIDRRFLTHELQIFGAPRIDVRRCDATSDAVVENANYDRVRKSRHSDARDISYRLTRTE